MTNRINNKNELKIILIGNPSVGKTCIIHYYETGKFLDDIPITQGASFIKVAKECENKKYSLYFWDTLGNEKYRSLTGKFVKNSKIVILVYSIIDRKSFEDLDYWLDIVKENNGDDGYVLGVAANKNDLYQNATVSDEEGQEYAKKINAIFTKTSVKDAVGINELIDGLLKQYINTYKEDIEPDFTKLENNKDNNNHKKKKCC